jgi:hypothetical protein
MRTRALLVFSLTCALACANESSDDLDSAHDGGLDGGGVDIPGDAGAGDTPGPDGASGPDDAGPLVTYALATYCNHAAQRYFDWLQMCFGTVPYPEDQRAKLAGAWEATCNLAQRAVDEGRLAYDPAAAKACVERFAALDCEGFSFSSLSIACPDAFQGQVATGESCYYGEQRIFLIGRDECASGLCDYQTMCPGKCVTPPAIGEPCVSSACAADAYCLDGMCVARKAVGEPCAGNECAQGASCLMLDGTGICGVGQGTGSPCDADHRCAAGLSCLDGACHTKVLDGAHCESDFNCSGASICWDSDGDGDDECAAPATIDAPCEGNQRCEAGLYCDMGDGSLTRGVCKTLPAPPEPCASERCAEGAWCHHDVDQAVGTCRVLGQKDGDCTSFGVPTELGCDAAFQCIDGTCQPRGAALDASCSQVPGACAEGLFCDPETSRCVNPKGMGESCLVGVVDSCATGLACLCDASDFNTCIMPDTPHHCGTPKAVGEPCAESGECQSKVCDVLGPDDTQHCLAQATFECVPMP